MDVTVVAADAAVDAGTLISVSGFSFSDFACADLINSCCSAIADAGMLSVFSANAKAAAAFRFSFTLRQ